MIVDECDHRRNGRSSSAWASKGGGDISPGMAVEILLLLRAISSPQKRKLVTAEVDRLGFEVWDLKDAANASR